MQALDESGMGGGNFMLQFLDEWGTEEKDCHQIPVT